MLKNLARLALPALAAFTIGSIGASTGAQAEKAKLKEFVYNVESAWTTMIVTSSDGNQWDGIKPGNLQFWAHMKVDTKWPGYVYQVGVVLGNCGGESCKDFPILWSDGPDVRDYVHQRNFSVPTQLYEGPPAGLALERQNIIAECNKHLAADGATKRYEFQHVSPTTFLVDTEKVWGSIIAEADAAGYNHPGQIDHAKTGSFTFNVVCEPFVRLTGTDDLKLDHGELKATGVELTLKTYANDTHEPHPGVSCPVLHVTTRVTASQIGLVPADRIGQIGGGAQFTDNLLIGTSHAGGLFTGETTKKYYLGEGTFAKFYARIQSGASVVTTPWKSIVIHCNNAGGGFTVDTDTGNPDNGMPPQAQTLEGDFSFFDHGAPECPREGKALLTFQSPKTDNIHYSLDCDHGHFSGVTTPALNPAGGYIGAAVVAFDVNQTLDASCTLRTVAPYGPKTHVTREHRFQCVQRAVETGSDDLQVAPRPSAGSVPPVVAKRGTVKTSPRVVAPERTRRLVVDPPRRERDLRALQIEKRRLKAKADAERLRKAKLIAAERTRKAKLIAAERARKAATAAAAARLKVVPPRRRAVSPAVRRNLTARPSLKLAPRTRALVPGVRSLNTAPAVSGRLFRNR